MSAQLVLPLAQEFSERSFANYYAAADSAVVHHVQHLLASQKPSDGVMYLAGPAATGKTHLLQAACQQHLAQGHSAMYIACAQILSDARYNPGYFDGLANVSLLCIDDVHCLVGHKQWEEACFHLYNQARAANCLLLFAGRQTPSGLGCCLPDLQSRLGWGLVLQLPQLSDEEKIAALALRASARGLVMGQAVLDYLLRYMARDMQQLVDCFEKLDAAAWQCQRRLTVAFVKQVLDL